jgi:uncharacterized membrane protein required for colicin V production
MRCLLPGDYAVLLLTAAVALTGLFRGFSSIVAFVLSSLSAIFFSAWVWPQSAFWFEFFWYRVFVAGVLTILVFAAVRAFFTKVVKFLLAQPGDSIFGFISGFFLGGVIFYALSRVEIARQYSFIAEYFFTFGF